MKMEAMVRGRTEALAILSESDQPDIPETPPPLYVDLHGYRERGGVPMWPGFGGAPRGPGGGF